jgi:hypothetical protein
MKCSKFKGGSELNINYSTIQGLNIEPYDIHLGLYGVRPQVTSQFSSGASRHRNFVGLGWHTNLLVGSLPSPPLPSWFSQKKKAWYEALKEYKNSRADWKYIAGRYKLENKRKQPETNSSGPVHVCVALLELCRIGFLDKNCNLIWMLFLFLLSFCTYFFLLINSQ